MLTIQRAALSEYLYWLYDRNFNYYQFYNPPGGLPQFDWMKPMLGVQDCQALLALCCHHFLCYSLFPSIIWENGVPVRYLYETETETKIHCRAVREFLD